MTTTAIWTATWWWWLLAVALSWLGLEVLSLIKGHVTGQQHIEEWTLSDTIRRWSSARRWLAPLVVGAAAMLLMHFFGQANPG